MGPKDVSELLLFELVFELCDICFVLPYFCQNNWTCFASILIQVHVTFSAAFFLSNNITFNSFFIKCSARTG